ncbi:hypothetical protein EGW08_017434 [Elysia chlorotica]|uniref:Uncharacterized protein n=1 Tax=Elysia chlorotica TaxID=188477 RepID=A0A3S1AXI5_ELYCH|nr:hypothetical protein EGW08_017434 [Elysia chlorotica]
MILREAKLIGKIQSYIGEADYELFVYCTRDKMYNKSKLEKTSSMLNEALLLCQTATTNNPYVLMCARTSNFIVNTRIIIIVFRQGDGISVCVIEGRMKTKI